MADSLEHKINQISYELTIHQTALDNVSAYIFMKDLDGRYTYANKMVRELFNCSLEEIVGQDDSSFFSLDDSDEITVNDTYVMVNGVSIEKEERNVIMETGEVRYYWTTKKPLFDAKGKVIGLNGISTDITDQKQMQTNLRDNERQLKTIINHVDAYIYMKDREGKFLFINDKTADLFGVHASEVKGKTTRQLLPPELADNFDILDHKILASEEKVEGEEVFSNELGPDKYYWSTKIPIKDEKGKLVSFVGFSTEITKIVEQRKEFKEQAATDELTGIANRRHFMAEAYSKQASAIHKGSSMSVMIIDLDYFKRVNDSFGHHIGDVVLKEIAIELTQSVRSNDLVARMGGEEFAVLLPCTNLYQASLVAEKLRLKITSLVIPEKTGLSLTASIGIASCELHPEGVGAAMIKADEALYCAKHNGRNQVAT
ncbi:sensor domain-containing diguanylate cyclase [Marinomonas sp. PE14-40]|uniref:sensor domain-containing diguanylate cyclase n=1 Tax=Marinomonas sp. PE14-40 TaxID=3060621 RepID=UPI003F6816A1